MTYNDHLQIVGIQYSKSATDLLKLAYGYGTQNNGQIATIADNTVSGDHSRDLSYTYDAWSRLNSAQAGPNGTETWKYDYNYDRFGNRINQNSRAGTGFSTSTPTNANTNRINDSGVGYDYAGNMTADGTGFHTYTYDAENRLMTVDNTAASYAYDGDGLRIARTTGGATTYYVFSGSKVLAEYSALLMPRTRARNTFTAWAWLLP